MPIRDAFRPGPISRFRATLAIVFAGAAVLAAGGMLEYASGSPAAGTVQSTTFWAVFFGLNLVAFGGAALLGALPSLTRPLVKLGWALVLLALYLVEFRLWWRQHPGSFAEAASSWLGHTSIHVPAAIALLAGLLWGAPPEAPDDGSDSASS
jgi:hypothetical protein